MKREGATPDPGDFLRRFRRSYTNFRARWNTPDAVPDGVVLQTPDERPLSDADLPDALRGRLEAYRTAHPGQRLTYLKYARFVDGDPRTVVEDDAGLPSEQHLLTLSQTVTLNTSDTLQVVTDLYVLRRE